MASKAGARYLSAVSRGIIITWWAFPSPSSTNVSVVLPAEFFTIFPLCVENFSFLFPVLLPCHTQRRLVTIAFRYGGLSKPSPKKHPAHGFVPCAGCFWIYFCPIKRTILFSNFFLGFLRQKFRQPPQFFFVVKGYFNRSFFFCAVDFYFASHLLGQQDLHFVKESIPFWRF